MGGATLRDCTGHASGFTFGFGLCPVRVIHIYSHVSPSLSVCISLSVFHPQQFMQLPVAVHRVGRWYLKGGFVWSSSSP